MPTQKNESIAPHIFHDTSFLINMLAVACSSSSYWKYMYFCSLIAKSCLNFFQNLMGNKPLLDLPDAKFSDHLHHYFFSYAFPELLKFYDSGTVGMKTILYKKIIFYQLVPQSLCCGLWVDDRNDDVKRKLFYIFMLKENVLHFLSCFRSLLSMASIFGHIPCRLSCWRLP